MGRHSITKATLADAEELGIPPGVFARRWFILATLCGSLLSVMIANGSVNLALPSMATKLDLGSLGLAWVVEIYSLVFAALLFTFAAISDRYGRKLVMQLGLVVFILSSLYAGLVASSGTELILTRAVMGIGGSMVMPTTLSLVNVVFPPQERSRAVAIWTGIAGIGLMLGFVVGGVLLEHLGWESTFYLSAGIAAATLGCNQWLIRESRDKRRTPVDWLGGFLSTAGLLGLLYGITEAPSRGLGDLWVVAGLGAACVFLSTFVAWQRKTSHPMLDLQLFRHRAFGVSALVVILAFFALGGVFFGVSQLFMLVMGYGAFKTSIAIIPLMGPMLVLSPFVPFVTARAGIRWTVTTGLVLIAVGFDVMSRWPTVPTLGQIYGGMSILTSGLALAMTPATSLMMSAVPRSRSGMGSAMNDTTRELGAALGIATLGALLSSGYAEKIASALAGAPEQARVVAERSLAGALVLASNYGDVGAQFAQLAKAAWMESLEFSMVIGGVICSVSAIVASIWLPHREKWDPSRAEEPAATVPARTSTATTRAAEPGVAASPRTTRRPRRSRLPLEEDA